jgi:hypothetical protein
MVARSTRTNDDVQDFEGLEGSLKKWNNATQETEKVEKKVDWTFCSKNVTNSWEILIRH